MLENLFPELPCFDKKAGRSVTDRLNMGRLYIFNLFGCVGVLLICAVLSLFKVSLLPSAYQVFGLVIFSFIMASSAATVFLVTKLRRTDLFGKVCFGYLFVFSAVMYNFAFKAVSCTTTLIFYWIIMLVIGCLPVFSPEIFAVVWAIDFIPAIILMVVKHFSAETVATMIMIGIMCFGLSIAMYANSVRKLDYKLRLDSALSEAETDPMTLLLNRRGLDRRTDNIWPHCIRQRAKVAIIMVDIDNFKKYNDTYGHAAGDECIRKVTGAIRRSVKRRTDYAARVGGEEFLVMLTGIEPKLAVKWALELKKSIEDLKIPHSDTNFNPYVSVSMGLACAEVTENISFEKLREEADKALYEAKYNGRACLFYHHKAFGKQTPYKRTASGD